MAEPLHCGRISYTNDLPVYAAFDTGAIQCPAGLTSGVPAQLNEMLLEGRLDVSPISSAFYGMHAQQFVVLPDVCIGSRREVRSIYCVSAAQPSALADVPIAVTTESATGRMLFAVVCAEQFGFVPRYVESEDPFARYLADGSPCLLIGDKAIDAFVGAKPGEAHDVGLLWHEATGLQMVYALWAVRRSVAASKPAAVRALAAALRDSLSWGRANIDVIIDTAQRIVPRNPGFYADYYSALTFDFDEPAQAGLCRFFELALRHGFLKTAPRIEFLPEVPAGV
jgi:chorismate dehydratase